MTTQDSSSKARQGRRDGLTLLLLGSVVLVMLGFVLRAASPEAMSDFKTPFYSARCLLRGCDPYDQHAAAQIYNLDAQNARQTSRSGRSSSLFKKPLTIPFLYPPTIFSATAPLALLSYSFASFLWTVFSAAGLIVGSYLMWGIGAKWSPLVAALLLAFLLANSELPVIVGNPASIAIGLCVIATWCFYRERFEVFGSICLGISLLVKPHDVLFIWVYFLWAGGNYRKRSLQAAIAAAVIGIPIIAWTTHVSPSWPAELQTLIAHANAPGGINDPGPKAAEAHGLAMVIHLQTAVSFFRDDARFYNGVSYLICGTLLLVWGITTMRTKATPRRMWLALASISALTMLPFYHRACDAKLLMLAAPACALLWSGGGRIGKWALFFTTMAFVCNADLTWLIVLEGISKTPLPPSEFTNRIVAAVQILPPPLSLLAVGVFYLWVYVRRAPEAGEEIEAV